jgi:radical SAM protein with 4Fe4S-binding SPASM domain
MIVYKPGNIDVKMNMRTLKYPLMVYFKITSKCNLNCDFCSQKLLQKDMDLEFAKKQLRIFKKLGIVFINYTGGEPLLYKNLYELLKYGYELGFKQIIVTNGLLLDKNMYIIKYIISLGVSLHGNKEIHNKLTNVDSFKRITNNLSKISNNIKVNINCTAEKLNMNYETFKFLAEYCKNNSFKFSIARLNYIGKGKNYKQDVAKLVSLVDRLICEGYSIKISNCIAPCLLQEKYRYLAHGCGAGNSICAIEQNGDVKICSSSNYILGNLYKDRFQKIWFQNKLKDLRSLRFLPPQCTVCKSVNVCKGACRAEKDNFWSEISDKLVLEHFNNIWDEIKDKKINLNLSMIRFDYSKYTLISSPVRKCNRTAKNIITSIDGNKTGKEIMESYPKSKESIKNFLIALKIDNIINYN